VPAGTAVGAVEEQGDEGVGDAGGGGVSCHLHHPDRRAGGCGQAERRLWVSSGCLQGLNGSDFSTEKVAVWQEGVCGALTAPWGRETPSVHGSGWP